MANELSAYALLTIDEAKDALKLGDDFDDQDKLIRYVNSVTALIERECSRQFLSREVTETFDGDGTSRHILDDGLEITVVSKVVYNGDGDEAPAVSIAFNNFGEIRLSDGYTFENGFQNCSVTFTRGLATVPADIALAAMIILKSLWKMDDNQRERVASVSLQGQTISFKPDAIPPEARMILDNWPRRPRFA
jgi:hypothetical protein